LLLIGFLGLGGGALEEPDLEAEALRGGGGGFAFGRDCIPVCSWENG
jgi:hypothetical protein